MSLIFPNPEDSFVFCVCLCDTVWSVPCSLAITCLESALVCDVFLSFCHFPIRCGGQVWYLIVSIPDQGLLSILSLSCKEFIKFNNSTRARMLDCIYNMTVRLLLNIVSVVKRFNFVITCYVCNVVMGVITFPKICNSLVVYRRHKIVNGKVC